MRAHERPMNIPVVLEKLFWTFVAAVLTNLGSAAILDLDVWKAAVLSGVNAATTFVLLVARYRLAVLPDPGHGLPGLPSDLDD